MPVNGGQAALVDALRTTPFNGAPLTRATLAVQRVDAAA